MTKLEEKVQSKCHDMGLSKNAIDGLLNAMGKEINDDAEEEEIDKVATQIAEVAKTMQGEATRWANKSKKDAEAKNGKLEAAKTDKDDEPDDDGTPSLAKQIADAVAAAVKPLQEQLNNLNGAATTKSRKEVLEKALEGASESLRKMVMDGFEHRSFENDDEFNAYVTETTAGVKSINDEMNASGLRGHAAPQRQGNRNADGVSTGVADYIKSIQGEGDAGALKGKQL